MANRISSVFEFKSSGLSKVKADIAGVDGAWNKARTGFKSATAEFKASRGAQLAAVAAIGTVVTQSIQAASALEESANGVKVAYGEAGDAVLALGENAADQFGLSARAFNDFAIRVSGFATQIAEKDGRAVADVVSELTQRAVDFASAMGIDSTEAVNTFMSALSGETEPMRRFGKDVSAAAVEQKLLNEGIVESKNQITEADKVLGRYLVIMDETANTAGDWKNTQESLANQTKLLTANVEDLQAEVGEKLTPAVADAVDNLNEFYDVLDKIKVVDVATEVASWGGAVNIFASAWNKLTGDTDDAAASADEYGKHVNALNAHLVAARQEQEAASEATGEHAERMARAENRTRNYAWANRDLADELEDVEDAAYDADYRLDGLYSTIRGIINYVEHEEALQELSDKILEAGENAELSVEDLARLRLEVLEYGDQVAGLPTDILTEIDAMIDEGSFAEAEERLRTLTRARFAPIQPLVSGGNTVGQVGPYHTGTAHARGGMSLVGEYGPELVHLPSGARVDSAAKTARQVGSATGGGMTVNVTVNAGMGTDGRKVGDEILRTIEQALRTGSQLPPTLKRRLG